MTEKIDVSCPPIFFKYILTYEKMIHINKLHSCMSFYYKIYKGNLKVIKGITSSPIYQMIYKFVSQILTLLY